MPRFKHTFDQIVEMRADCQDSGLLRSAQFLARSGWSCMRVTEIAAAALARDDVVVETRRGPSWKGLPRLAAAEGRRLYPLPVWTSKADRQAYSEAKHAGTVYANALVLKAIGRSDGVVEMIAEEFQRCMAARRA